MTERDVAGRWSEKRRRRLDADGEQSPRTEPRRVMLRDERSGSDRRCLWAYVDADGNLHIDGQDLGPSTAPVSTDGEYEWFQKIQAADVPRVLELLHAPPDADVLDVLAREWTGSKRAAELEELLRESDVPVERFVWSS